MELPKDFNPDFEGLSEALKGDATVSIRRNVAKSDPFPDGVQTVPWCPEGMYINDRPQFTFDPALHQGIYYVQDASSMIYSHILHQLTRPGMPVAYLDACAAPGGKTTTAIDALPDGSLIVANEFVPVRANTLKENLIKWGCPAIVVSKGDTVRFRTLPGTFDIIAADVPCSGEGMFRKDAEAVRQWTPALVNECALRQKSIIDNLWPALKEGGYLIYSTCTFNRQENEEMVEWILDNYDASVVEIDVPAEWGIVRRGTCLHFLPGKVRGEGLTVAVIQKGGDGVHRNFSTKTRKEPPADKKLAYECRGWLKNCDDFVIEATSNSVRAFPRQWAPLLKELSKRLDVIYAGIEVATPKGRDLIPSHSLAMSTAFASEAFPSVEVDYPTAISYLRREAVTLPADVPKGFILLTNHNHPLGFVKNLGNRANNLYPNEWRILSTHIPTAPTKLF
ncbi:MAG: rRNA cytosine-C5-methyltransferase [Muribaculum sp.]|nr:rRNA cytosine-C5-methyltransferase [Muribaculum sp.]